MVSTIILSVAVFLISVAVGLVMLKKAKKEVSAILTIITGFVFGVGVFISLAIKDIYTSVMAFVVVMVVFITFNMFNRKNLPTALFAGIIALFFVIMFSGFMMPIYEDNAVIHESYYEYEIIMDGDKITISCDGKELPEEAKIIINKKVEAMKEVAQNYYKGSIREKIYCYNPWLLKNHDSKCTCTEDEFCINCEKNSLSPEYEEIE